MRRKSNLKVALGLKQTVKAELNFIHVTTVCIGLRLNFNLKFLHKSSTLKLPTTSMTFPKQPSVEANATRHGQQTH